MPVAPAAPPAPRDRTRLLALVMIGFGLALLVRNVAQPQDHSESIRMPLRDSTAAHVQIDTGNGTLRLTPSSPDRDLISGRVGFSGELEQLDEGDQERDIMLGVRSAGWGLLRSSHGTDWQLQLNPRPTYDLDINTGNGSNTLDLSTLTVGRLEVEGGNGSIKLALPTAGNLSGSLRLGNGDITLTVPQGRAMQLTVDHGNGELHLGALQKVDSSDDEDGGIYQTAGYRDDQPHIDLQVESGNGDLTVRQP